MITTEASIVNAIREARHQEADPASITPMGGGSINACFQVSATTSELFVKVNHAERYPFMFEREIAGLDLLRAESSFLVPKAYGISYQGDHAVLVMECLEKGISSETTDQRFAAALAAMHRQTQSQFGLEDDNFIGSLPQWNDPMERWTDFFISQRLDPMLEKAVDAGWMDKNDISLFERLYGSLEEHFPEEPPALLHGDLWAGNYMVVKGGLPALFDPAVYYGHRYLDLGMMQLFGGFQPHVFDGYRTHYPLDPNWREGTEVANLYPLLVHVNLFGSSYVQQVRSTLLRFT